MDDATETNLVLDEAAQDMWEATGKCPSELMEDVGCPTPDDMTHAACWGVFWRDVAYTRSLLRHPERSTMEEREDAYHWLKAIGKPEPMQYNPGEIDRLA